MADAPGAGVFAYEDGALAKRRVTQCALSRICGVCGRSLERPVHFVGTTQEEGRNAFHFPPVHEGCADAVPVEGERVTLSTSGFEFVRPERSWADPRPVFSPNSVIARWGADRGEDADSTRA